MNKKVNRDDVENIHIKPAVNGWVVEIEYKDQPDECYVHGTMSAVTEFLNNHISG